MDIQRVETTLRAWFTDTARLGFLHWRDTNQHERLSWLQRIDRPVDLSTLTTGDSLLTVQHALVVRVDQYVLVGSHQFDVTEFDAKMHDLLELHAFEIQ